MKKLACVLLLLVLVKNTNANVKPNNVFSNNMVLQRNAKVPVWGTAEEGEKVRLTFGEQKVSTTAKQGKWMLWLQPMPANNQPQVMEIEGKNKITITNVLVGEVWFCSGQSNMEMCVGKYKMYRGVQGYEDALKDVNHPTIRVLQIPHYSSGLPLPETNVAWRVCTDSATIYWGSAVAWFFAKKLNKELNVPVGLINAAWGGSPIQAWTPPSILKESNDFEKERRTLEVGDSLYSTSTHLQKEEWEKAIFQVMDTLSVVPPSEQWISRPPLPVQSGHKLSYPNPSSLYNAMVAPIIPYCIHGVLWYQGETNLGDGMFYAKRMEALVSGWRKAWGEGSFPFYYVQIAPFAYKDWPVKNATPDLLPKLWEAQKAALSIPNTAMVPTDDLGELDDIHPIRKKEIGERLADLVLKNLNN
ncbi:sialate O-acetylesterase [Parasediminibacterium sp. JCM 36343]|uniref:sialate O-acetylesterase n=1 Tax=Parasediminibacterium sp. JCM 36343 TaxID=3374279 RepID=UPI00397B6A5D